jgi:hypothetical protein
VRYFDIYYWSKDAKDFDDALSLKQLENGNYEIGIHIADVSYLGRYTLDDEAYQRATSVYLVDRVVPAYSSTHPILLVRYVPMKKIYIFSNFEINEKCSSGWINGLEEL